MKITNTIDINAAPEKVFYWLSHPSRAMEWMTSVYKTEILHETPDMVGTTFREIIGDTGGSTEMRGVITGYVPNQKMAFHLEGDFNTIDVEYRLEQMGDITRLTQEADVQLQPIFQLFSFIIWPMFKKQISAQSKQEFAKLKELCEQKS
jgi:uncharacterized protein YndB with AHSA1/START domain